MLQLTVRVLDLEVLGGVFFFYFVNENVLEVALLTAKQDNFHMCWM